MLERAQPASLRFEKLRQLYHLYLQDLEALSLFTYGTALMSAENQYESLKAECKAEYSSLKELQKSLDERTLKIEQQLYLGLPDDLKEMERVINEQELIVEDQQKLNQLEENLIEKMRRIDINHGKKLAAIEAERSQPKQPTSDLQNSFLAKVDKEEKKEAMLTKLYTLAPVILLPIFVDTVAIKWGLQKTAEGSLIFSHYVFLITFILLEVLFAGKIKEAISASTSKKACISLAKELEMPWMENQEKVQKLEKQYGLTLAQVTGALEEKP